MNEKADEDYENIWKPLLMTDGKLDPVKVKNEMTDLIFIYKQVAKVYDAITGGQLSKPMYYADVVISLYNDEITKAYDQGWKDAKEDKD